MTERVLMTDRQLDRLSNVVKVLTDPARLRIVELLQTQGELAVNDICAALQIRQSLISSKLGKMARLNLVQARREGQRVYYSLVDPIAIRLDLILGVGATCFIEPSSP